MGQPRLCDSVMLTERLVVCARGARGEQGVSGVPRGPCELRACEPSLLKWSAASRPRLRGALRHGFTS